MDTRSRSSEIPDDGEPATALQIAAEALRDFNYRSATPMVIGQPGWTFVPDAYDTLGQLRAVAGRLPQAVQLITVAVRDQLDRGLIGMDEGAGSPVDAVEALSVALDRATWAAEELIGAVAAAQEAVAGAHYAAPAEDL